MPNYPPILPTVYDRFRVEETVKRIDIKEVQRDGKPAFLLVNLLSKNECKTLINECERFGFERADTFCHLYNDRLNDRMISDDKDLCDLLFQRCAHLIPEKLHYVGYDEGEWTLSHLNPRWRYCKYTEGHYFGRHTDGAYREPRDPYSPVRRRSFLTFMLYLNDKDEFEGGATNFIKKDKITKSIDPSAGTAIVFLQEDRDMLHEGEKLHSGTKYILRTDIMYSQPTKK
ncbi:hypothetical protein AKO1_002526 [Acrasis kona]|uniref:PKHD-type hydroxylase n=1 Tax=Acrasis kona TaxID=1008807 RepID=A0AAW2ZCD7_9EUKA